MGPQTHRREGTNYLMLGEKDKDRQWLHHHPYLASLRLKPCPQCGHGCCP